MVRKLTWRSPDLDEYVRRLDILHLAMRYGRNGRIKAGGAPRRRVRQNKLIDVDAEPVPGLPENFYAEAYLKGLSPQERRALDIQPRVRMKVPSIVVK